MHLLMQRKATTCSYDEEIACVVLLFIRGMVWEPKISLDLLN